MEHKLINGGEQYLPFARSRIKALKATGLKYAAQQFEIDGASIKVRLAGDQEHITLDGGQDVWVWVGLTDVTRVFSGSDKTGVSDLHTYTHTSKLFKMRGFDPKAAALYHTGCDVETRLETADPTVYYGDRASYNNTYSSWRRAPGPPPVGAKTQMASGYAEDFMPFRGVAAIISTTLTHDSSTVYTLVNTGPVTSADVASEGMTSIGYTATIGAFAKDWNLTTQRSGSSSHTGESSSTSTNSGIRPVNFRSTAPYRPYFSYEENVASGLSDAPQRMMKFPFSFGKQGGKPIVPWDAATDTTDPLKLVPAESSIRTIYAMYLVAVDAKTILVGGIPGYGPKTLWRAEQRRYPAQASGAEFTKSLDLRELPGIASDPQFLQAMNQTPVYEYPTNAQGGYDLTASANFGDATIRSSDGTGDNSYRSFIRVRIKVA